MIPLQDQLALVEQLAHRARHLGFALDPLDVEILGVLVRSVIGIHRLAERLRGRLPVAIMVAIAVGARLALPGNGPELLRNLLTVLRLLTFLCLLTGALGGKPLLTLRLCCMAPIANARAAQGGRERMKPARSPPPCTQVGRRTWRARDVEERMH